MPPLGFTDEELNSVTALAPPLPAAARGDFLQLVADRLSGYPEQARGSGLVNRSATEAQGDFLNVAVWRHLAGAWREVGITSGDGKAA